MPLIDHDGLFPCCRVECQHCHNPSCECACRLGDKYLRNGAHHTMYGTAYDHINKRPLYLPLPPSMQ